MPENISTHSPVIILGMHRSGTTMIAAMLRQLGLFIGNDLEDNLESMFFINHNDWILRQSGATWDNPAAIEYFLSEEKLLTLAEGYLRDRMSGLSVIHYTGLKRYVLRQTPLSRLSQPWGWKDPRTTFTLPLWLRLFPDARVIHIFRNGVSVAASLRARERKLLHKAEIMHCKRKASGMYRVVPKKGGFLWSPRCLSLEGGFSLWEQYVETAISMLNLVAPRSLTIKYEDFLAHPAAALRMASDFCNLTPSEEKIHLIASAANPERSNAFQHDKELREFYTSVMSRPLMKTLGYEKDVS